MKDIRFSIFVAIWFIAYTSLVFHSGRMIERRWARERVYVLGGDLDRNNLMDRTLKNEMTPWALEKKHRGLRPI